MICRDGLCISHLYVQCKGHIVEISEFKQIITCDTDNALNVISLMPYTVVNYM